jgi:hypothetical protein
MTAAYRKTSSANQPWQAFRALQSAYIQLLQNPFYSPDDHIPVPGKPVASLAACQPISNKRFVMDVKHIGDSWVPGAAL